MKVVALFLVCLPALAMGNFEDCQGFVNFPQENMTGYNSYIWELAENGVDCQGAAQTCQTEFPQNNRLRDRSWFITDNKDVTGLMYNRRGLQLSNVQCPVGTRLHLFPQFLQTEDTSLANPMCTDADFVRVNNEDLTDIDDTAGRNTFCGNDEDRRDTQLFNSGLGIVSTSSRASVEFCTNDNTNVGLPPGVTGRSLVRGPLADIATGYVVRATCIDARNAYQPGCADYQFFRDWDPEWLELQNMDYTKPQTADFPHKRSVEKKKLSVRAMQKHQAKLERQTERRMKRFSQLIVYELDEDSFVEFENGLFTITFGNGTVLRPRIRFPCLLAESEFFGIGEPRKFFFDGPFPFRGPGFLEIDGNNRLPYIFHTVNESSTDALQEVLTPNPEAMRIVNNIYEYIFNCWIRPYPITHRPDGSRIMPLPRSRNVNGRLQAQRLNVNRISANPNNPIPPRFQDIQGSEGLGFLMESFWPIPNVPQDNTCFRGTLIRAAPLFNEETERLIASFCGLFSFACNPIIRIACDEFERLR